jgi:hypothetical protein
MRAKKKKLVVEMTVQKWGKLHLRVKLTEATRSNGNRT